MFKKAIRPLFLAGLLACILSVGSMMLVPPAFATFCAAICAPPPSFCPPGQVPVTWTGPACTGNEPPCHTACIG